MSCSVGGSQDGPDFGVLGHERSQPVIVMRILPGDVAVGERQVAVSASIIDHGLSQMFA